MVGRSGRHIRADVSGVVVCKAFLSGMPVRDPNRPISDRVAPPFHSHSHGCMRNHSTRNTGISAQTPNEDTARRCLKQNTRPRAAAPLSRPKFRGDGGSGSRFPIAAALSLGPCLIL